MSTHVASHRTAGNGLKALFLALLIALTSTSVLAQSRLKEPPRREELLNGLRVQMWHRPADANVLLKLRIHASILRRNWAVALK
jgi:hypothetical protein